MSPIGDIPPPNKGQSRELVAAMGENTVTVATATGPPPLALTLVDIVASVAVIARF